jgi:DNA-binding CsgD family transcriptional regulator/tetratricopeptide (TPR) repeat protein
LLAEQAISVMWSGHLSEAEELSRAILAREHEPIVDGSIQACLLNMLIARGRNAEALQQLDQMLSSSSASDAELAANWAWVAIAHWSRGEVSSAYSAATKAKDLAQPVDDPVVGSLVFGCLSMVHEARAELSQALTCADDAVRLADQSREHAAHRYPVRVCQARVLLDLDRFAEAHAALEVGRQVSQQIGALWMGPMLDTALAVERFLVGEWDDALAEAETAEQLARDVDEGSSIAERLSVVALVALHQGDLSGARTAVGTTAVAPSDHGPWFRWSWIALVQALLLEAEGAPREGLAVLADRWDDCLGAGLAMVYPVLGPDLVRLALVDGQQQRAEQVCAAVVDLADVQEVPSLRGAAMRCRGLVERKPELSVAAADAYALAGRPLETAQSREEAGALLGRDAGIPLLEDARGGFETLGASRDVARVDARLRTLGVRRGPRGMRRRPTFGWESLTPTERTVVDLVAEGLSNPQIGERLFVSRRTVQTHLAHVFRKLDISSRAQLAAEAARRR